MGIRKTNWVALPGGRLPDRPLFAIGDVHGYPAPLEALQRRIAEITRADYGDTGAELVYLGDYVDRGPDPLGVLAALRAGAGEPSLTEIALYGNHDWYLIQAAGLRDARPDAAQTEHWLRYGGLQTIAGLGLERWDLKPKAIRARLGAQNVAFLEDLRVSHRNGAMFCVHAGLDPTAPLDRQDPHHMIWIRNAFLGVGREGWPFDLTVVHGHTPDAAGVFHHRIGVDTGGCFGGPFTAAEITPAGKVRFHHVDP